MKKTVLLCLAGVLSACSNTNAVPGQEEVASCEKLVPCVSSGRVAILGEDPNAIDLLEASLKGAEQFAFYFGFEPQPIAVVTGGIITPELRAEIETAGYPNALPWVSSSDRQLLIEGSIRRQVLEQTEGMPEAEQNRIIERALAKANVAATTKQVAESISPIELGALTHELGHIWFIASFTPAHEEGGAGHGYGGWAPDWLDEASAILLENDTLTERRRASLRALPISDLYPLATLLSMEHPALKAAEALNDRKIEGQTPGSSRAIVLTSEEAEQFLAQSESADPTIFYTQVRAFIDFLTARTENDRIIAEIAQSISSGNSFQTWLQTQASLADNITDLELDWLDWVALQKEP